MLHYNCPTDTLPCGCRCGRHRAIVEDLGRAPSLALVMLRSIRPWCPACTSPSPISSTDGVSKTRYKPHSAPHSNQAASTPVRIAPILCQCALPPMCCSVIMQLQAAEVPWSHGSGQASGPNILGRPGRASNLRTQGTRPGIKRRGPPGTGRTATLHTCYIDSTIV